MRPHRDNACVEIVVARYRECIKWTRNTPPPCAVTIYNKGPAIEGTTRVLELPNVGLEAQTYLHHVVKHYDTLAPVTVFCQGYPFDHAPYLHVFLRALAAGETKVDGFRWLGFIIDSDDPKGRRLFVPWRKNENGRELPLAAFHQTLFGTPAPKWSHFYAGAQFAVTRQQVRRRPKSFYEHALLMAEHFVDAGYCYERVWDKVFDAVGVPPRLLNGGLCRYLKPVNRLKGRSHICD